MIIVAFRLDYRQPVNDPLSVHFSIQCLPDAKSICCPWVTARGGKRSMIGLWQGGQRSMKHKSRSLKQHKHPKTRLRLPDLEFSKTTVLNSLSSVDGQRGYGHAIDEFVD